MTQKLVERQGADHEDFDQSLPRVGCALCGAHVQATGNVARLAQRRQDDPEAEVSADELAAAINADLAEMGAWSTEHAKTHSEAEHKRFAKLAGG